MKESAVLGFFFCIVKDQRKGGKKPRIVKRSPIQRAWLCFLTGSLPPNVINLHLILFPFFLFSSSLLHSLFVIYVFISFFLFFFDWEGVREVGWGYINR